MKILFLFATLLLLSKSQVAAQTCTPQPNDSKGVFTYPKGSEFINGFWYFPKAYETVAYGEVFQVLIPKDTLIEVPGGGSTILVPVSYSQIDSVTGLPPGMGYKCNPPNCKFEAQKQGCTILYGTPPPNSRGRYQVRIYGRTEVKTFGIPTVLPGSLERFFIEVADKTTALSEEQLAQIVVYPNPASTQIVVKVPDLQVLDIKIISSTGQQQGLPFQRIAQEYIAELKNFTAGLYVIKIQTQQGEIHKKIVVE